MAADEKEPPYEGGAQPVEEHPTAIEGTGRSALQVVVIVICAAVLVAAAAWFLVPLLGVG